MNKKTLGLTFLVLAILLSATHVIAIEDRLITETQNTGPRQLTPEEVQKVKQGIMENLLSKVQQKTERNYRVSIQIWDKGVLETLQKTDGVTIVRIFPRRVVADVNGKVLEKILQEKLSGKHIEINLITPDVGASDQTQTTSGQALPSEISPGQILPLAASSRSYTFSGGLSPPDDTEDWWAIYVYSYEDLIEIDSQIYDWIGCDVDLYLYDPNLNLRDQDTWDFNGLDVSSNTDVEGYWYWQYWGEYLDDDGTGYSGTVTIYDN